MKPLSRLRTRAARFMLVFVLIATMTPVYGVAGEPSPPEPERRVRAEEPSRARDAWRAPVAGLGDASDYVAGEVLVRFKRGASIAARGDAHSRVGGQRVRGFDIVPGLELVRLPAGTSVTEAIRSYQRTSAVSYAQPNYRKRIAATVPNDPSFGQLWGLKNTGQSSGTPGADIKATDAWDITTGSRDIVVAVIDTGVDYTHPDLVENMWVNPGEIPGNGIDDDGNGYIDDIHGIDTYNGTSVPLDDQSHGTHCAGTIGAVGDDGFGVAGVNWNVSIMAIKALDSDGWGTTESVVEAFEYAAAMGADVMNNSWGGDYVFDQAEYDAIAATDALFVFAAGNESVNNDGATPFYPASYDLPNIISVAASTRTDTRAGFSNIGATTVDVFAPGADILSTIPTGRKTFVPDVASTLYATDFTGLEDWLLSEEGDSQPWTLTSAAYTSPPTSLGYTSYEVSDLAYADSPSIDCSAAKSVYLNAKVRYDLEQDGDYLDAYVFDGVEWRWAGYKTGSSGGEFEDWWIDITPWAAGRSDVQVSFGFDASGLLGSSGGYEGAYVDDVRVVTPVETTTYFSDNLSTLTKWNTAMYAVDPWGLSSVDYVSAPSSAAHTGYKNDELSLLMQSDGVDMSGQDAALLRFKTRYNVEYEGDWFGVWTSGSGMGWAESWFTGDSEGWRAQTVVLPEPGVDMAAAFILESDYSLDSSDGYEGAYVDDVEWVGLSGTWVADDASEAYEYKNGTSMAAPHVAGIAALVLAVAPETEWATLKEIILDSAEPIPALDGLCVTGARVDAYAALTAEPSTSDIQHDAAGVVFDRWVTGYSTAYSGGGYVYSRWAGTKLTATFTGTKIRWYGPKQPAYGMADVYIDGALVASSVDCYAPAGEATLEALIWESGELTEGEHTIEVRLTGAKNPASSAYFVVIDRFEVDGAAPAGGGIRYNENDGVFAGSWLHYLNPTYFDKTYSYSRWTNATFTLSFEGTGVSWIGPRTPNYGMADVYIDGVKVATVDQYKPVLANQGWREVVWQSGTLSPGSHTLEIKPLGTKNPSATEANIVIDAFDVTP